MPEHQRQTKCLLEAKAAFAAAVLSSAGQTATHSNAYSVPQGTSPSFIQHIGTISRTAVRYGHSLKNGD